MIEGFPQQAETPRGLDRLRAVGASLVMGASRSERPITRRERAVASGSPPRPRGRQDDSVQRNPYLAIQQDGERRASEGDPEGAFGSPQREPAARDTAEWRRPLGAAQCSRSRGTGGVSGARSEGDPLGAFRTCEARARPQRRIPYPSEGRAGAGPLAGPEHRAGRRGTRGAYSSIHPSESNGSRTAHLSVS